MNDDQFEWPDDSDDEAENLADGLLFDEALPPDHRSGFVAVVGRPNVGKSTLMNHYLGQKIAIVSPKPQTTRNRLLGILTRPDAQLIFVDTPGIHNPHHKLGEYLVDEAARAIPDADVIVWLVDGSTPPTAEDRLALEAITARRPAEAPVLPVVNKVDLLPAAAVAGRVAEFEALLQSAPAMPLSAVTGYHCPDLLAAIINRLPPGPRYFPKDQITDQQTRFIAAEMVREAALKTLRQEVPHAIAVLVDEFTRRSEELVYISASLMVERDSQKGIVIGKKGRSLKRIGQLARPQIEKLVQAKVFLELRVKVLPKWRKKKQELRRLGYSTD